MGGIVKCAFRRAHGFQHFQAALYIARAEVKPRLHANEAMSICCNFGHAGNGKYLYYSPVTPSMEKKRVHQKCRRRNVWGNKRFILPSTVTLDMAEKLDGTCHKK